MSNVKYSKAIKVVSTILMVLMLLSVANTVFAGGPKPSDFDGTSSSVNTDGIKTVGNSIVKIIMWVGAAVSVIVLLILGIKYMMGSASEKAEYKKTMIPYIIGAGLVFGATTIAGFVMDTMSKVAG